MKFKKSILFQITLILNISIFILMFIVGFILFFLEYKKSYNKIIKDANTSIERLAHTLIEPLWNFNDTEIKILLEFEISNSKDILSIFLYDDKNNIILGVYKDNNSKINKTKAFQHRKILSNYSFLQLKKDIFKSDINLGSIEIFFVDDNLKKNLYIIIRNIVIQILSISILIIIVLYYTIKNIIIKKIIILNNVVEDFKNKNFSVRANIESEDEFGNLSKNFNLMASIIQKYNQSLEEMVIEKTNEINKKNKILLEELIMAQKIQLTMIPNNNSLPKKNNIYFASEYIALESIGGDIFDVVEIEDNIYGIMIADVTGHGVPAAFISLIVKVLFNIKIRDYYKTNNFLTNKITYELNNEICSLISGLSYDLTAFICILNMNTKEMFFTNAAHPFPIYYNSNEKKIEMLETEDTYIGIVPNINYSYKFKKINSYDKLLLFTDGLIESTNNNEEFYDYKRVINILKNNLNKKPYELISIFLEDLENFCESKNFKDDIAILCVDFL